MAILMGWKRIFTGRSMDMATTWQTMITVRLCSRLPQARTRLWAIATISGFVLHPAGRIGFI